LKEKNPKKVVLLIDDDRIFCSALKDHFSSVDVEVFTAHTAEDGLKICSGRKISLVLLDQRLPDAEGHTLCPAILKHNDQTKIIFVTAYPNFENALNAIKMGAHDYLSKPFELAELDIAIERSFKIQYLEKIEQIQSYTVKKDSEETILAGSLGGTLQLAELAASSEAPVLITGETGTGKSLLAKFVHYKSSVRKNAFISINCSAIPENLIESELFGHTKGAFTGALSDKKGIFEMADGGTLYLDEIGCMPLSLQPKLLSVLEDKKIRRLGGDSEKPVDVRIIASTNIDIDKSIEEKTFREDLYYRLNVIRVHIPPLRERREDIPELCNFWIKRIGGTRDIRLPEGELKKLVHYPWPGNVRELRNILERSVILSRDTFIEPSKLLMEREAPSLNNTNAEEINRLDTLEKVEKDHIRRMMDHHASNYTRTARALGISLSTLKRKVHRYNLLPARSK